MPKTVSPALDDIVRHNQGNDCGDNWDWQRRDRDVGQWRLVWIGIAGGVMVLRELYRIAGGLGF